MRNLTLLFLILCGAPAAAADLKGTWRMTAEGKTALLLTLQTAGDGSWIGRIVRPTGMAIDDGTYISGMTETAGDRALVGKSVGSESVELRLSDAGKGEDQVRFRVTEYDDNHAEFVIDLAGTASRPVALVKATDQEQLAKGWANRSYRIDAAWSDNADMRAMFDADQKARMGSNIDWSKLNVEDAARRAKTAELLKAGKLRSASDFYAAAFIFQHGSEAQDYLLAHSFAILAAARGRPEASWIASATLDRYLQKIGQPQIYGTQYFTRPNEPVTQEPYNRALLPDSLRDALGVPPMAVQEERRKQLQIQRDAAKSAQPAKR